VLNKRGSLRKIVTDAAKIDRTGIEFGFAVRCTVGVAIPLLITVANGSTLAGVSAAYGALVTGFASRQGVYRTRAIGMLLTAFALACSGFAGIMTGAHPVANVIVGALWAAAFGLIAAIGRAATVASVNSVVAFIIFSNPPYDLSDPWFQAAMVIAGGVLQTLLLVLVWPLQRFRTERHALAAAYRALARYADHVNVDDLGLPDSASLVEVRATLADPQPFGSRNELAVFEVLADEAERLRTSLAALTSDYHLLAEVGMTAAASAIGDVAVKASALLAALADAVDRGVEPLDPDARFAALARAVEAVEVALVLRPDFSSTFTRGLARISGTVGGAVIASGVAAFHPPPSAYVALAIVFAALSFALFNVSYAVFSAAITGYVVYLLAFGGSPEHAAAIDRVLATAIGGLLAFAAYVAWPTWARDHVAEDLALLLEAQSAFARHVLQAFLEPQNFDAGAMRAAQLASRLQRTNTEAAVDLMKSEPVSTRGISLATAQGILAASRRIGVASLTMGARIGDREDASRDVLARLIADFDTAMAIVVRSLRDVATPAPLPPLRDDQTALARAVAADPDAHWEVLASETDVLVDSADTIAELLRRR
jgi:uncharacterized membrane protein YccC